MSKKIERDVRDFLFRQNHYLQRVENNTLKELMVPYAQAKKDIYESVMKLESSGAGYTLDWRIAQAQAKMTEIDEVLNQISANNAGYFNSVRSEVANITSESMESFLSGKFGQVGIGISPLPYRQIDFILSNPLRGESIGSKFLWANADAVRAMRGELVQSIIQGEDIAKATKRIVGPLTTTKIFEGVGYSKIYDRANIIARTEIQHVSNSVARGIFFENQDVLKGVMFSAALDNRTCYQCAALDGMQYDYKDGANDHDGPQIPLHPRCRCVYVPITKSWSELEGRAPEKDSKNMFVEDSAMPLKITYESWLRKQNETDPKMVKDFLGPARYKLWDSGKITMNQMANQKKIFTLAELEEKLKGTSGLAARIVPADVRAKMSARQLQSLDNYVPVDKKVRDVAEATEREVAKNLGAEHIIGNLPFDIVKDREWIEMKTLISGRGQIRMRPESKKKKLDFIKKYNGRAHTILADKRRDSETFGKYFYRKGLGDFQPKTMTEVKSWKHLNELLQKGRPKEILKEAIVKVPKSKNLEQAVAYAKNNFKIKNVDFDEIDAKAGDLLNQYLGGTINSLKITPKTISFADDVFVGKYRGVAALAQENGTIYFNRTFFKTVSEIENTIAFNAKAGQFLTSSPGHIIRHELAHLKYFHKGGTEATAAMKLTKTQINEISKAIGKGNLPKYMSKYGMKNQGEFYAEAVAAQMNGQRLHPVINKIVKDIEKSLKKNLVKTTAI